MEKKQSFIFYTEWSDVIAGQEPSVRLEIYESVIEYATAGTEHEFTSDTAKLAFAFIRRDIDRNTEKFEEIREKRKEAIKKRWENQKENEESKAIQTHTKAYKAIQTHTKAIQNDTNDTINDNVNVNVNVNENDNNNIIKKQQNNKTTKQQHAHTCAREEKNAASGEKEEATEQGTEQAAENKKSVEQDKKDKEREERRTKWLNEFAAWWNSLRMRTNTRMRPLSTIDFNKRRQGIIDMVKKYGEETFCKVCQKAQTSDFCNGRTKERNKPVEFDWALLIEENFIRLMEGYI